MAPDIFRRFYIDGRLHYHILIDREQPALQPVYKLSPEEIRELQKYTVSEY